MEDTGLDIPIEILDESLRINSRGFFLYGVTPSAQ
jgi:hypothetical protein